MSKFENALTRSFRPMLATISCRRLADLSCVRLVSIFILFLFQAMPSSAFADDCANSTGSMIVERPGSCLKEPGWIDVGAGMVVINKAGITQQNAVGNLVAIRAYPLGRWYAPIKSQTMDSDQLVTKKLEITRTLANDADTKKADAKTKLRDAAQDIINDADIKAIHQLYAAAKKARDKIPINETVRDDLATLKIDTNELITSATSAKNAINSIDYKEAVQQAKTGSDLARVVDDISNDLKVKLPEILFLDAKKALSIADDRASTAGEYAIAASKLADSARDAKGIIDKTSKAGEAQTSAREAASAQNTADNANNDIALGMQAALNEFGNNFAIKEHGGLRHIGKRISFFLGRSVGGFDSRAVSGDINAFGMAFDIAPEFAIVWGRAWFNLPEQAGVTNNTRSASFFGAQINLNAFKAMRGLTGSY